jgi:peptidoglycan/xylan/chitin deacetylase (PgdA/CDA1 family)
LINTPREHERLGSRAHPLATHRAHAKVTEQNNDCFYIDSPPVYRLEFGVYSGDSIALMATHPKAPSTLHGFDSFVGLVRLRFSLLQNGVVAVNNIFASHLHPTKTKLAFTVGRTHCALDCELIHLR